MEIQEKDTKEIENNKIQIFKIPWVQSLASFLFIFGLLFIFIFWQIERSKIFIENSYLDAPIVNITSITPGALNALYVKEGDKVRANSQIALVGSQMIYTKEDGVVATAPTVLGAYYSPGQSVVSVVSNQKMKVIGKIEETKGLKNIQSGQKVVFSVDAFPGKKYEGIVEQVSSISDENGVLFSISDKRPIKKFDVKVLFDTSLYPELKSGMSAKMTIYTR